MSQDLPIDIHYNKLQDWLLSRRHCKADWCSEVLPIREKINIAIQDMPPIDSIKLLLHGTYINYFHCKEIVDILKETEGSTRTLFGSYSSKRLKDWIEIVKAYEKNNIYMAEAAQLLSRCVNFEVPSLKRQLTKASQALQEYHKKQLDYHRGSLEAADKFQVACKRLGIEGKKIKRELVGLLKGLPSFFDEVVEDIRRCDNEVNFYCEFKLFLSSGSISSDSILPLTRHLSAKGNTSVYEWRCGEAPVDVEQVVVDYGVEGGEEEEKEGEGETKEDEIDWGNLDVEVENSEIDWGIEDVGVVEAKNLDADALNPCLTGGTQTGVARGEDALTLLQSLDTRNQLLNELHELDAFFSQRLAEMKMSDSSNFLDTLIFQTAPQSILLTTDDISCMLSNIRSLIAKFSRPNIKELFLICSFPKHVDRIFERLEDLRLSSEKMEAQSKVMVLRQVEKNEEINELQPKLDVLREKTKILKKMMEEDISQKYKNRQVNIMGEINSI